MPSTTDPDGATFEQLRPRLTAISRRIVGSQADAEDIVQDCYLKWHGLEQTALATPAAWLTTVVQHQSIDRLRRRARDEAAARMAMEAGPGLAPALPEDQLLRQAELGEAFACLARLPPSERLALVLHEAFECSHADIAAVLGTKAANARQHLARARRRLRAAESIEQPPQEKLCRELVRRFEAAINGLDLPAVVTLLAAEQPTFVHEAPQSRLRTGPCANDALYGFTLAA